MMKTIVLGYNESDSSKRALERAAGLARAFGSKLVVTSVTPVLVGGQAVEQPGPELQRAGAKAAELGLEAELVEAVGDAAEAICHVAELHGADLVVVGTREPSLVERSLGHSVSEQVQRRAHCDVLIVH
jgi:nucleotide-binding universal stress UspA family protein